MASFLAARVKTLERQRFKPKVRRTIAEFDPANGLSADASLAKRVMRVPSWPSSEAWSLALAKQQARLTEDAASK